MIKVTFIPQGQANAFDPKLYTGEAIARRGSKTLIRYSIQSGESRERWFPRERVKSWEGGEIDQLPEIKALRSEATLPDGKKRTMTAEPGSKKRIVGFAVACSTPEYSCRTVDGPRIRAAHCRVYGPVFATKEEAEISAFQHAQADGRRNEELKASHACWTEKFERGEQKWNPGTWEEPVVSAYSVVEFVEKGTKR